MSASPIPLIDLAAFYSASPAERARVVQVVRKALEEIGSLTISGNGVAQSLIDRANQVCLDFFDRPEEENLRYCPAKPGSRGYNAFKGRTVGIAQDPSLERSLPESFAVGRIDVPDDPCFTSNEAGHRFAPNIWPDEPGDFKQVMSDYYRAMDSTYNIIMRLFAVVLDLPETYFDSMINKHGSLLRLSHYPALDGEPLPGSFIINIGDMMMRWTNDKYTSKWYRVVNPAMVKGRSERRLSLVFVAAANYDTMFECLPNRSDADHPPLYPPLNAQVYAAERFDKRYGIEEPTAKAA